MKDIGDTLDAHNRFKIIDERILLIVIGIQYNPTIQMMQFIMVGNTPKGEITPKIFHTELTKKQYKKEKTKQTPGPKSDFQ